jgi:hypothetical protein
MFITVYAPACCLTALLFPYILHLKSVSLYNPFGYYVLVLCIGAAYDDVYVNFSCLFAFYTSFPPHIEPCDNDFNAAFFVFPLGGFPS